MVVTEDAKMDFSYVSELTVENLMSEDLLTVYEGWSVKHLAEFFVENNISGAPVVASDGELVGVVTQSDVLKFASRDISEEEIEKLATRFLGPFGGDLSKEELETYRDKSAENCTVNMIMTPKVFHVDQSTKAIDASRLIVNKNIHRLFVTDDSRLVGVMTAMDFLGHILGEQ